MPIILNPTNNSTEDREDKGRQALLNANFGYDYPRGLDLKPGSELHDDIKDRLIRRAYDSQRIMSRRYKDWERIDKTLRVYVPPEPSTEEGGEKEKSYEIVVPESYATLDVLLTYMSSAFLQDQIWSYSGVGPEDALGAQLMSHVINQQAKHFRAGLALHTQWRDAFSYGFGAVTPVWHREMGTKTEVREEGFLDRVSNIFLLNRAERRRSGRVLKYEGNKIKNIDPYSFLPDPNVSIHEVHEAEFVGWIESTNTMSLLNRDRDDKDHVFNAKYVDLIDGRSSIQQAHGNIPNRGDNDRYTNTNNPCDILWMYVTIIPSRWGVGDGEYPEEWLFGLAGDQVVVTAQPLGLDHGEKPIAVCAPDYDGYSINPTSRLGIIHDMQTLVDFLYTSHIQNIRKAINDMLVIDPSIINYYDVANPKPGKIIRARRAGWGRGVIRDSFEQLKVDDITRGHIADAGLMSSLMQKVSSANENVQGGFPHRTSRISATEARTSRMGSLSRLEKAAKIISEQSMQRLGRLLADQTQQLMEQETYIKVTGELGQRLQEEYGINPRQDRVKLSPLDLVVNYDIEAHDGTIPGAEDAENWVQLYQVLMQSDPSVTTRFNKVAIFKHIARQLGARNVDAFELKGKAMQDEQVMREVERGNLVEPNQTA